MSDPRSTSKPSPPEAKVISLAEARQLRWAGSREEHYAYQARILGMDKLALLEEMVRFQQKRSERGELTPQMILQGKSLFKALEEKAETEELRSLARSYRRHLEHELAARVATDGESADFQSKRAVPHSPGEESR
ncbi:MAG: hypothetical protein RJB38_395 [Pseudomonadota bacterium]|jgi:hypothetical protein